MRKKLCILTFLLFASLILTSFSDSNVLESTVFLKGCYGFGIPAPLISTSIQLDSMNIVINMFRTHADISGTFIIKNKGGDETVTLGLPYAFNYMKDSKITWPTLINASLKDDSNIPFKRAFVQKNDLFNGFESYYAYPWETYNNQNAFAYAMYTADIFIKQNETKQLTLECTCYYDSLEGYQKISGNYGTLSYEKKWCNSKTFRLFLSTGRKWKDNISEGTIKFLFNGIHPNNLPLFPGVSLKSTKSMYEYSFKNYKPLSTDLIQITRDFSEEIFDTRSLEKAYGRDISGIFYELFYHKTEPQYYLLHQDYDVTASSYLKDPSYYYGPSAVKDFNAGTCWVEGKDDDGLGESITLKLPKPLMIPKISLVPGVVAGSETLFNENNRITQIKITVNGEKEFYFDLSDDYTTNDLLDPNAYFLLDIASYTKPVKTIQITILGVAPGTKYRDTAITEVLLWEPVDYPDELK